MIFVVRIPVATKIRHPQRLSKLVLQTFLARQVRHALEPHTHREGRNCLEPMKLDKLRKRLAPPFVKPHGFMLGLSSRVGVPDDGMKS